MVNTSKNYFFVYSTPVKKQLLKRGSSIAVDNLLQQALQIRGILKNVAPDFVDCVSIRETSNGLSVYVEGFSSTKLAESASRLSDSQLFLVDEIINRQQKHTGQNTTT